MKISRTTEYTIRTIAYLAKHSANGNVLVKDIAEQENMPYFFIGKLLQQMRRCGYVISYKGRGGGFRITEKAKECSILELIVAVQGELNLDNWLFDFRDCPTDKPCNFCEKWQHISEQITNLLMTQKVGDLAN